MLYYSNHQLALNTTLYVGICSDTPHELIMCCKCPRSFCMTCLSRILSEQQKEDLDNPADWICMCCMNDVTQSSPSLNSSKWQMIGPNHKKNGRYYGSNKYDVKDKNNNINDFLTEEFMSLLSIPKRACKSKNKVKDKNKKIKKSYDHSDPTGRSKMCSLQYSTEVLKKRDTLSNKKIDVNCVQVESSSFSKSHSFTASVSKQKSTRNNDVTIIMGEKVKKCIINDFSMNSENKIQNKLLDDIYKGMTPLRNCRLQKFNQNFDEILPDIKLTSTSTNACKTQLKSNKGQSLNLKKCTPVNISKMNPELSLPPVSSTVDEVYYFSQYLHVSYLISFFYRYLPFKNNC